MKLYSKVLTLTLLASNIFIFSCYYNKAEVTPSTEECKDVITNVSFSKDIIPILTTNCAKSGCHAGSNPEGNLNLEAANAYASLLKQGSGYVDSINPKSSVLYSSLVSITNPMPPTGPLSICDLKRIETWMKQGAKND